MAEWRSSMSEYRIEMTVTNLFLVPPLGIGRERLRLQNLIDAYIKDAGSDLEYTDVVYLLFKPDDMELFQEFVEEERQRTDLLIDEYDYAGGFIVLVYKTHPEDKEDIELIFKGQYSKISQRYKKKIPAVVKQVIRGLHKDSISLQYEIIAKSQNVKDWWKKELDIDIPEGSEVWSIPDLEKETLYIDKIRRKYGISTT